MNTPFSFENLIPVAFMLVQAFLFLFICTSLLKSFRLLKLPYAGMEYSSVILVAFIIFGVFFITTSDIQGLFQAFKTYQNQGQKVMAQTASRFSLFFLVILFFEFLLGLVSFLIIKLLFRFKNSAVEIQEGNIPASVLMGVIILGFSIIFQFCAKQMIENITPQYLNFR